MHSRLKGVIKPAVVIMAALPSMVLGFIAGLWLAPMMERVAPGIFLMPIVIPLLILTALLLWRLLPAKIRAWIQPVTEIFLLIPLLLFGMTFLVNTAAELVRLRLRKRYQCL